jgi:hypothetical protein
MTGSAYADRGADRSSSMCLGIGAHGGSGQGVRNASRVSAWLQWNRGEAEVVSMGVVPSGVCRGGGEEYAFRYAACSRISLRLTFSG